MIRLVRLWLPIAVMGLSLPAQAASSQVKKLLRELKGRKAEKAASQLADLGAEALPATFTALKNKNWKIRYWAAYAVAYSKAAKESGGVEALKPLLEDRNPLVALRGAMALAKLGDKSGLALAKENLKSGKAELRAEALAALAAGGDAEVVPQLKEALQDSSPKVRFWALLGLRDLAGKEAVEIAMKYLSDSDGEVKRAALDVLGSGGAGNPEVEGALIKLLVGGEATTRQAVAAVLARVGSKKALAPLRKLRETDRAAFVRDTADAAVVEITKRLKSE
jgi:HEAT repeat protein